MNETWLILFIPLGAFVGAFVGFLIFKRKSKLFDKKLIKDAQEVLDGTKENKFDLDGKDVNVNRFRTRDYNDDEELITFGDEKIEYHESIS